jgi:hypothetical protein
MRCSLRIEAACRGSFQKPLSEEIFSISWSLALTASSSKAPPKLGGLCAQSPELLFAFVREHG